MPWRIAFVTPAGGCPRLPSGSGALDAPSLLAGPPGLFLGRGPGAVASAGFVAVVFSLVGASTGGFNSASVATRSEIATTGAGGPAIASSSVALTNPSWLASMRYRPGGSPEITNLPASSVQLTQLLFVSAFEMRTVAPGTPVPSDVPTAPLTPMPVTCGTETAPATFACPPVCLFDVPVSCP